MTKKIIKGLKSVKGKKKKEPMTFTETLLSWARTLLGAILVVMIINGLAIASFVVPTGSMEKTVMTGDFLFVNKFLYGPSTPQVIPFLNIPLPYFRFPGIREPEKGDVIVFIFPGSRDRAEPENFQYYLKRCVAAPGDTLQIIDNKLIVNGKEVPIASEGEFDKNMPVYPRDHLETFPPGKGYTRINFGPLKIPKEGDIIQLNQRNLQEWLMFIQREEHKVTTDGVNILIDGKPETSYTVERDYCFGMGDNRDHSLDSRYWGFIPVEDVVGTPLIVYWSWDTGLPLSKIIDKFVSVRWSRIGTIID